VALTSNSDFYVAIHDAGINRIVKHLMRQRPSLFNYGTSLLLRNPDMLCQDVDVSPEVLRAGNPIITVLDPLPVIGTSLGLNYSVQLTKGEIDFHPSNAISLPPELNPPLANQRLGIHFQVCAGIGCPTGRLLLPGRFAASELTTVKLSASNIRIPTSDIPGISLPGREITVLPTSKLECFCLDFFATCGAGITGFVGNQKIQPRVDGIEIVDLKPEGLENGIECYALLALNQGIIPTLADSISTLAFDTINLPNNMGKIRASASTTVPNNPAIEQDQLKAFVNIEQIELNITVPPTICKLPPTGGPTLTRTIRPRTRTGVFDLTAAISEKAFEKIFSAVVKGFKLLCSDSGSFGPFSASYTVAAHLEGGTIDLRSNGTVKVSELDVKWDTLNLNLCLEIPEQCVGGGCIIPDPFDGCILSVPEFCFFSGNPDFCIPLSLSGLITSEITFTAGIQVFYGTGSGVPNRWQIVIVPTLPFDLDFIDVADTVGDLVENLVDAAIDGLFGGAPDWAKDLLRAILGPLDDFVRFVLDIPDDIGEWVLNGLTDLGIFDVLLTALNGFLTNIVPPLEIEDPRLILEAEGSLIPVKLPIEFIGIRIDDNEMVIQGDVGN